MSAIVLLAAIKLERKIKKTCAEILVNAKYFCNSDDRPGNKLSLFFFPTYSRK